MSQPVHHSYIRKKKKEEEGKGGFVILMRRVSSCWSWSALYG
ncbi:MAG: hypothetical protein ACKESB_03315 [Candidatus Hodgkinia cicadicola]